MSIMLAGDDTVKIETFILETDLKVFSICQTAPPTNYKFIKYKNTSLVLTTIIVVKIIPGNSVIRIFI